MLILSRKEGCGMGDCENCNQEQCDTCDKIDEITGSGLRGLKKYSDMKPAMYGDILSITIEEYEDNGIK